MPSFIKKRKTSQKLRKKSPKMFRIKRRSIPPKRYNKSIKRRSKHTRRYDGNNETIVQDIMKNMTESPEQIAIKIKKPDGDSFIIFLDKNASSGQLYLQLEDKLDIINFKLGQTTKQNGKLVQYILPNSLYTPLNSNTTFEIFV